MRELLVASSFFKVSFGRDPMCVLPSKAAEVGVLVAVFEMCSLSLLFLQ